LKVLASTVIQPSFLIDENGYLVEMNLITFSERSLTVGVISGNSSFPSRTART